MALVISENFSVSKVQREKKIATLINHSSLVSTVSWQVGRVELVGWTEINHNK